ncbi:hypothetical protein GCM10009060_02090 [Halorubrum trapanicum]
MEASASFPWLRRASDLGHAEIVGSEPTPAILQSVYVASDEVVIGLSCGNGPFVDENELCTDFENSLLLGRFIRKMRFTGFLQSISTLWKV